MAKPLVFVFQDVELPFNLDKVDRAKMYGWVDVEAQDAEGRRCQLATLADDGRTLIARGGTALATLSAEGEWLAKTQLKPVDPEGKPIVPVPSSLNAPVRLERTVTVDEYLSHNVKSVYLIHCEGDAAALTAELAKGTIYSFPFSYRGGLEADVGFLLTGHDKSVFLIVAQPTRLHFVGLEQVAGLSEDEAPVEAEDDESLDFGMM